MTQGTKSAASELDSFAVSRRGGKLEPTEMNKYCDYLAEAGKKRCSFMGELFIRFKALNQEESLWKGLKKSLSTKASWEDKPVYGAYWSDHQAFDVLSNYYGNQYRGSFIFIYLMGALAVLAALIPVGFSFEERFGHDAHHYAVWFTIAEFLIISTILVIHKVGANPLSHHGSHSSLKGWFNRRWHERWIDYRTLAEKFRYMEILYPVGINPFDIGGSKEGDDRKLDSSDWVNAYFLFRVSQAQTVTTSDSAAYKMRLRQLIESQAAYHKSNACRSERIYHRTHTLATWLFYGTLGACTLHFFWHSPLLTLAAGFFPALAAAMHGILANGEFSKTAAVSEKMHTSLDELVSRLDDAKSDGEVRQVAANFYHLAVSDAMNWKSIFMDKNVPLA